MSDYGGLIKSLKNNKINTPVFTIHDFTANKKYNVDINNVISFFKSYCTELQIKDMNKWQSAPLLALGEISGDTIPLITEFVFKFESNGKNYKDERFYSDKLIHGLINCHQEVIREVVYISSRATETYCAVLESDYWQENNTINVKLKFQFPFCRVSKKNITDIIRPKLVSKCRSEKLQRYFTTSTPIGDWDDYLLGIKDIYCLYGSTNNSKIPPTLFKGVYGEFEDGNCRELAIQNVYNFHNHSFIVSGNCLEEEIETLCEEEDDDYQLSIFLLPFFLSIHFNPTVSRLREREHEEINHEIKSNSISEKDEDDDEQSDLEIALEMIEMFKDNRFENENFFNDIGKALYYITDGGDEGRKIWIQFAESRSSKFDADYCDNKYDSFDEFDITVKTLAWYARQDNLDKYDRWHLEWCLPKLQDSCRNNFPHVVVAEAFYRVFWLDYMWDNNIWYEFRRSKLVALKNDIPIRRAITDKFIPKFDKLREIIQKQKTEISSHVSRSQKNREKAADLEKVISETSKLIIKLYNDGFRGQIVKTSREYFWKEDLTKLLNKDYRLLGVKNCVIEMSETRAYARSGKPEDYITKKVGVMYRYDYSYDHPDVQAILLYFRQVFPNTSLNNHMKKDVSSMLYGRNSDKLFRLWIGDTNGSKSVYQKILRYMFGEYYADLPPEYYSAPQKSSGPNPELAQAIDARVTFSAEPDDDTSFKGPRLKRVAGGDSFFSRNCHDNGGSSETTFKPIIVLNLVPEITGLDEATMGRLHQIPFEGRWLRPDEPDFKNIPSDIEEQIKMKTYPMDKHFEDNVPRLATALLWFAVNHFKVFKKEGLNLPPYVKKWMTEYWRDHDPYMNFIYEKLENPKVNKTCEKCNGDGKDCVDCKSKGFISVIDVRKSLTGGEVHTEFRRWARESYPHLANVNASSFKSIMETKDKLGKQDKRRWHGIAFKKPEIAAIGDE